MKYVGTIHNNISNQDLYGGKGNKLITIANLGINVPPGFILNTKSYKTFIEESKFCDELQKNLSQDYAKDDVLRLSKTINHLILNSMIPKSISFELKMAYDTLKSNYGKKISFAVRSSANIEDTARFSFAGQAESFLNNKTLLDIFDSVKKCWASLFSPQSLLYLLHMQKKGIKLSLLDIEIAVIIQKMLFPQCSGVLFTANVINNNHNQMMINSTWGLGDVVTNNIINPDLIIIEKSNGTIVKKVVGEKEQLSMVHPNKSSTRLTDMEENLRNQCSLNGIHLKKLHELGLQLEKHLKGPQDIEWAIEKGNVYTLQSRRITTLR